MAKLGEAYIAVHADLTPFRVDLQREVPVLADALEAALNKGLDQARESGKVRAAALGDETIHIISSKWEKKLGELGDRGGKTFLTRFKKIIDDDNGGGFVGAITKGFGALGTVLDNGISSLPVEVKAAIVLGIVAAAPFVIAQLGSAVSAGIAVGVVGLGVALTSQFVAVEESAVSLGRTLREALVRSSEPFLLPVLNAISQINDFLPTLETKLHRIFGESSSFIQPLVNGLLGFVDQILDGLDRGLGSNGAGALVNALADGFFYLGDAIGDAFEILLKSGEDGQVALRDLIIQLGSLLVFAAKLIAVFEGMYVSMRKFLNDIPTVIAVLFPPLYAAKSAFESVDDAVESADKQATAYAYTNVELGVTVDSVISKTDAETKALKDEAKAMDTARDAAFASVDAHLAYEQALDDMTEALKENGKAFDFEGQKGRDNLEAVGDAIRRAQAYAEDRYNSQELNSIQAQQFYEQELAAIYKNAAAYGVTKKQIDAVYGSAIALLALPTRADGDPFNFITRSADSAYFAVVRAAAAASKLGGKNSSPSLSGFTPGTNGGGFQEYADGGIVDRPTFAMVGEDGAEAVIPMQKPARAAQLLRQSGLDQMLGSSATYVTAVFDGEPFQARIVKTVRGSQQVTARSVAYGVRS